MSELEKLYIEGELTNVADLQKLVRVLQSERNDWTATAKALQGGFNSLETKNKKLVGFLGELKRNIDAAISPLTL